MYASSSPVQPRHPDLGGAQAVKILIAGGFGVGKTTLVTTISEIKPLRTEERLSQLGAAYDDLTGVDGKTTTTVALDFGRITINPSVVLYLFGTPGQDRFWFMWKELSAGALGAVVLADTRRLDDCFGEIDEHDEKVGVELLWTSKHLDLLDQASEKYDLDPSALKAVAAGAMAAPMRYALDIGHHVPIHFCDVRDRESSKQVIVRLLEHLIASVRR